MPTGSRANSMVCIKAAHRSEPDHCQDSVVRPDQPSMALAQVCQQDRYQQGCTYCRSGSCTSNTPPPGHTTTCTALGVQMYGHHGGHLNVGAHVHHNSKPTHCDKAKGAHYTSWYRVNAHFWQTTADAVQLPTHTTQCECTAPLLGRQPTHMYAANAAHQRGALGCTVPSEQLQAGRRPCTAALSVHQHEVHTHETA